MAYEIVKLQEKELVGIHSKSSMETPDMKLWGRFYSEAYPVI